MNVLGSSEALGHYGYFNPLTTTNTYTIGTGQNHVKAGVRFTGEYFQYFATNPFYFYANIPVGVEVTIEVWETATLLGYPSGGTLVSTTTYEPPEQNSGWYWHGKSIDFSSLTAPHSSGLGYPYLIIVVYPTTGGESFTWSAGESAYAYNSPVYNGSTWSDLGTTPAKSLSFIVGGANLGEHATNDKTAGGGFFRFNGSLYAFAANKIWRYDDAASSPSATEYWEEITSLDDNLSTTGAVVFDNLVYFGNGGLTTTDYDRMNTSHVVTSTALNGKIFAKFKGLLWRAYTNYVEYSEDGTTWEPTATFGDPIYVTDDSDSVTGLCGMGEIMYAATTAGLVPIYPGDAITGGITWGSLHAQNGMRMVEFEGALYALVNGRVVRYTEDGSMQDVWMSRDEDTLVGRIGKVWDIEKVNNWLFALVEAAVTGGKPTVWAYQNNSWHHIATLPPNTISSLTGVVSNYDLFYDRTTNRLWIMTQDQLTYWIYIPDYALNPYNDAASTYMRTAWVEWDWFDSPILEAPKDYESVTIMGENFTSTQYVQVYWKDDDSTTWELLGTCNSNIEELRWGPPPYTTRPNTKRFKLGFLLVSDSATETPRIRAFRVKYHLMVSDWFRWNIQVDVSGRSGSLAMTADGTRHTLTNSQIKANLDALVKQVAPFLFMDVDGTYYEVKVTDANFAYSKWEYNESTSNSWWEGVYNIVIEQVTQGTYTPP
jgi:hypothetical protein